MRLLALSIVWLAAPQILSAALAISNAAVRQSEDGPPLATGADFTPGETVYFSFQVAGYNRSPMKKLRLNYRIEAFDPHGVLIAEPTQSILDANLTEEDSEWKPKIRDSIVIPTLAPAGTYKIAATVIDDISHAKAQSELTFRVNGHSVTPSTELMVKNFGFYRSDTDQQPIATPVYRPGDNLFARFDITGFRYGDRNTIGVSYDVAVVTAEGKQLYAQPKAAEEKSFSFYPKPYVPGGMSLSLQPNMRPGQYTIVLTIHDDVGHQTYESKQIFQVE
ncbi:MAG: hypothetical protein JWO80_3323 [Bryobacterales bacterium]|nr:hypothetical protein [Bryobacterales bacterium]